MSNTMGDTTLEEAGDSPEGTSTISRSGRKIKKNSLLAVYDSPDVIERRGRKPLGFKRGGKTSLTSRSHGNATRGRKPNGANARGDFQKRINQSKMLPYERQTDTDETSDDGYGERSHVGGHSSNNSHLTINGRLKSQAQSTYMLEKSFGKQKKLIGAHPVIGQKVKAVRKDKGSPRVTAYMLWAKEQRSVFAKKYPHLDFSTVSKKLSDLWATVPQNQKRMWKTKAAKLMKKKAQGSELLKNSTGSSFNHMKTSSQLLLQRKGLQNTLPDQVNLPKRPPGRPRKYPLVTKPDIPVPGPSTSSSSSLSLNFTQASPKSLPTLMLQQSVEEASFLNVKQESYEFKVTGTGTLDVAAHFSLLGESMKKMGAQLQSEPYEEQVGNEKLSSLLDSLLCSVGPLLCLTQLVPELNCIPENKLKNILNNLGYVMPGL